MSIKDQIRARLDEIERLTQAFGAALDTCYGFSPGMLLGGPTPGQMLARLPEFFRHALKTYVELRDALDSLRVTLAEAENSHQRRTELWPLNPEEHRHFFYMRKCELPRTWKLISSDGYESFSEVPHQILVDVAMLRNELGLLDTEDQPAQPLDLLSRRAARILDYVKEKRVMPTYDEIEHELQMSRSTISKALKELRARALVSPK